MPPMMSSNTSSVVGSSRLILASGQSSFGRLRTKVGWIRVGSIRLEKISLVISKSSHAGAIARPSFSAAAVFSALLRPNQSGSPVSAMIRSLYFASRHAPSNLITCPRRGVLDLEGSRDVAAKRGHEVPDQRHHAAVVGVGLVDLQHRELRVVLPRDALVAEIAPDLEHAVEAAHEQALQVELERNAQEEVAAERVVVRRERLRRGPARHGLQDRGLDLDELPRLEEPPDRGHDPAAQQQPAARLRVDDHVQVALAVDLLGIGQAVPLLGQRPEGFRDEHEALDADGDLAALRFEQRALGADDVAQVELPERRVGLVAERRPSSRRAG